MGKNKISEKWRAVTERIRDANPIDELLEERGVELRRVGQGWMCLCPLPGHYDTRPSLSISGDGGLFFCFGCERGGDVFKLVELVEGVDFLGAHRKLAKRAGIALPHQRGGTARRGR